MTRISIGDVSLNVLQQGSGSPLLLVHGFPLDHQMWHGQIEELSEDFHVLAPDLRGFGQSDVSLGTVTMAQFADDLAALLDQLRITQPVSFCGLSMGGYVAWQFWRRHRQRLSHLILCDTRAQADSADVARGRLETAENVLVEGASILVESMVPKLFSEATHQQRSHLIAATRQVMQSANPEGIAAALRGMAQRPNVTSWLNQIDVPSLLLCGEHDAISSVREMEAIAGAIPGAEFVVIPACGHMAPLEDPEGVNNAIRGFLGRAAFAGS